MKGGPQTWNQLEEKPVSLKRACISLDGTRIAAIFSDNLCIYDTTTGEAIRPPFKLEVDENPRSVVFSPDGKIVASGSHALRLWNVQTGEEIESFDIDVYSLAFSPNGTCIAAGCGGSYIKADDRGSYNIRVIDLELTNIPYPYIFIPSGEEGIKLLKGEVRPSPFEGHKSHVNSIAYSEDGKQIASCSDDGTVRIWDVSTGSRRTFASLDQINCVTFSPDGTQIASDRILFNLSTGCRTRHAFGKNRKILREVYSFSFSADGKFLASGSSLAAWQIWDASTHQTIVQFVGHLGEVRSVAFFPDGKQIMSASEDSTIRLWDVEFLEERGEMDEWQMYWSRDGYWILGPGMEQFFWTRLPFRHARNTLVIGECLKIDFSNFVHGDEWVKCREPL